MSKGKVVMEFVKDEDGETGEENIFILARRSIRRGRRGSMKVEEDERGKGGD
jgi:hypothetical protein